MRLIKHLFTEREFPLTMMRFHLVGILLYILPFTRDIFLIIIPLVLLLSLSLIFIFHNPWNIKTVLIFGLIFILSFLIEVKGVSDGIPFGKYTYYDTLGLKLFNTPLLIGVNWLMLVYGSNALASGIVNSSYFRIPLAAFMMVVYDLVIEFAAPVMNMWGFDQPYPPLRNFISWFVAAFIFQILLEVFHIKTGTNKHARILFIAQVLFFSVLSSYILIFNR